MTSTTEPQWRLIVGPEEWAEVRGCDTVLRAETMDWMTSLAQWGIANGCMVRRWLCVGAVRWDGERYEVEVLKRGIRRWIATPIPPPAGLIKYARKWNNDPHPRGYE